MVHRNCVLLVSYWSFKKKTCTKSKHSCSLYHCPKSHLSFVSQDFTKPSSPCHSSHMSQEKQISSEWVAEWKEVAYRLLCSRVTSIIYFRFTLRDFAKTCVRLMKESILYLKLASTYMTIIMSTKWKRKFASGTNHSKTLQKPKSILCYRDDI